MSDHAVLPSRASVVLTVLLKVLFGIAIVVGALWASSGEAHADGLLDDVIDIGPAVTDPVLDTVTDVAEPVVAVVPKVVKVVAAVPVVSKVITPAEEPEAVTAEPVVDRAEPTQKAKPAAPDARPSVTAAPTVTPVAAPARAEVAVGVELPSSPATPSTAPQDEPALTVTPSATGAVADLAGGAGGEVVASTRHGAARDLAPPGRPTFESDTTPD